MPANSELEAFRAQGWGEGLNELTPRGAQIMKEQTKHGWYQEQLGGVSLRQTCPEAAEGCLSTLPFLGPPSPQASLHSARSWGNVGLLGSGLPEEPQSSIPTPFVALGTHWSLGEHCEWPSAVTLAPLQGQLPLGIRTGSHMSLLVRPRHQAESHHPSS